MKKEEKTPINWEVCDPKPPVIHSGRRVAADNGSLQACSYPTYPDHTRFDTGLSE